MTIRDVLLNASVAFCFCLFLFVIFHLIRMKNKREIEKIERKKERMITILKDTYKRGYKDGFYDMQDIRNTNQEPKITYLSKNKLEEQTDKVMESMGFAVPKVELSVPKMELKDYTFKGGD